MESNPGTFGCSSVVRVSPPRLDDDVVITLTLGDARRLHSVLFKGLPSNEYNSIWVFRERLLKQLENESVNCKDLD